MGVENHSTFLILKKLEDNEKEREEEKHEMEKEEEDEEKDEEQHEFYKLLY